MSKKFNKLNLSPHWQQYFSKYPQGYTIIENLIDWVSQVDDMVDNQNTLNETVERYGDRLDEFIGQYDTHLQEIVEQTLGEWQNSGFLEIVINEALDTKYHEMDERLTSQLTQTANVVSEFNADPTGVEDSTQAFINAINSIKTPDTTEMVPENKVTRELIVPGGSYKITETIPVPSYISIKGAGKHNTFFESHINDGSPVFDVRSENGKQQFYVNLQDFTINGNNLNNQGVRIYKTSRWTVSNVHIIVTEHEGMYIYESYLGEVYSCLIKGCGSVVNRVEHPAIKLDGPSVGHGSHAVTFVGGEIHGGRTDGLWLNYGSSVSLFGMTIEGLAHGRGIVADTTNALTVSGCYFEGNIEHIVEISETISSSYKDNYFGFLTDGGRGHVGVTRAIGGVISDNFFYGSLPIKIFDATPDNSGFIRSGRVETNHGLSYPLKISESVLELSVSNGTSIESFDANNSNLIRGNQRFHDMITFNEPLRPYGGLERINSEFVKINADVGTPEGTVTTQKGLYFNTAGGEDDSVYIKKGPNNNALGWVPIQTIRSGPTSGRPTVTTNGYMFFDNALAKPIWWTGSRWVDAMGDEV